MCRIFRNWEAKLPFYTSPQRKHASASAQENHEDHSTIPESMPAHAESSTGPVPATTPPLDKRIYEIDGNSFTTLEGFYEQISAILIPGASWGHNLDAFDDILEGGFGTPDQGFTLVWRNSEVSRQRLGFEETVRQLRKRLRTCHPSNQDFIRQSIREAEMGRGQTVFEWLVEIILSHAEGGEGKQDGVVLILN